jgi:cobalt-zinc-cadmium efflux system outer membrane protein
MTMMTRQPKLLKIPLIVHIVLAALLSSGSLWADEAPVAALDEAAVAPADSILANLEDVDLRRLADEVLSRNPQLAALAAKARSAEQRAPQVRSLPDPMASLTLFLLKPQTRVGPQQAAVGVSQRFPWFGKLRLREQAALLDATAAWSRVESLRVELITKVRALYLELQYLESEQRIVLEDKTTLEHYEELARARYASGVGIGQSVIKIQAEITKARTRLLDIEERRVTLVAEINALRDRPEGTKVAAGAPEGSTTGLPTLEVIRERALARRPELGEAQALIDAAAVRVELAKKDRRPDLTAGLSYALVGKRDDLAGRLNPPEDNGRDILGVSGAVNLPIWRSKLDAEVEEAVQQRLAAEEMRRARIAEINGDIADLARRVPRIREQVALFDEILTAQAEESLRSAEAAYASGTVNALDLLDAERVLLGVRVAAERTRTDLAVAIARLEGTAAAPLGNGSAS